MVNTLINNDNLNHSTVKQSSVKLTAPSNYLSVKPLLCQISSLSNLSSVKPLLCQSFFLTKYSCIRTDLTSQFSVYLTCQPLICRTSYLSSHSSVQSLLCKTCYQSNLSSVKPHFFQASPLSNLSCQASSDKPTTTSNHSHIKPLLHQEGIICLLDRYFTDINKILQFILLIDLSNIYTTFSELNNL